MVSHLHLWPHTFSRALNQHADLVTASAYRHEYIRLFRLSGERLIWNLLDIIHILIKLNWKSYLSFPFFENYILEDYCVISHLHVCKCVCTRFRCCCYDNISTGAVTWRMSEKTQSQREKNNREKVCMLKSLNSYLPCVCQMALCTLLYNQNSESHFHAHTCSHCQTNTQRTMHMLQN